MIVNSVAAEANSDARHLSFTNIDDIWAAGHPVVLPVAGSPDCKLDIHPGHGTITLITPYVAPEPDLAKLRNITFQPTASDSGELARITVTIEGNVHGAYGLLTTVADQLQLHSEPIAAAVAAAVTKHRNLFADKTGLSKEKEIGLFGELLVLEYLIAKIGAEQAIESWQGPLSEEHDFAFSDVHLEIKTTSGELRRHMMHGYTQLVPLRGVPLSVISVQLTRTNHDGGSTLSQKVSRVRAMAGGHRPAVNDRLQNLGWDDGDVELYTTFWTKRDHLRAYDVDDRFPAFTAERLVQVIPNFKAVSDLTYRVDLTHFACSSLPGALADLVEAPEVQ